MISAYFSSDGTRLHGSEKLEVNRLAGDHAAWCSACATSPRAAAPVGHDGRDFDALVGLAKDTPRGEPRRGRGSTRLDQSRPGP
jgi:hypothetical protein